MGKIRCFSRRLSLLLVIPGVLLAISASAVEFAQGRVISVKVSIPPLQLQVRELLRDIATVEAVLDGPVSPHHHALKPSEMRKIKAADLLVWVGPGLESWLAKAAVSVAAFQYEQREGPSTVLNDPHFWLGLEESADFARRLVAEVGRRWPLHQPILERNLAIFLRQLVDLEVQNKTLIARIGPNPLPYLTYHRAYTRLARDLSQSEGQVVSASAERPPGAKHLAVLRRSVNRGAACLVVAEDELPAGKRYARALEVPWVVVDLLAANHQFASFAAYYRMVRDRFLTCFLGTRGNRAGE